MIYKLFISIFLIVSVSFGSITSGYAQLHVSGKVSDHSDNMSLFNALITLSRSEDSILVTFTRTDRNGHFAFYGLELGCYLLQISYPGYATFADTLQLLHRDSVYQGKFSLFRKAELLQEVIVRQQVAAIRIKGDTVEYKADSFALRPGATVEELLRALPGIQVDRNGQITAHGQKVNKILVDGEEFFSDDPAVVMQNIAADAVKEVQVFDKKSEQAEFTGVDDGQRSKTINLTIKADRKKGYFGKVMAGVGTRHTFDNDAMLNKFTGDRKMSAFVIVSKTGRSGLNMEEGMQYGSGNDMQYDEMNGYFSVFNLEDEFNQETSGDEGIPTNIAGGAHYSDKTGDGRKSVNTNYRFLQRDLRLNASTLTQNILPDSQYLTVQKEKVDRVRRRHALKGIYNWSIDSLNTIRFTASGTTSTTHAVNDFLNSSELENGHVVNQNSRRLSSRTINNVLNTEVLWRKKFRRTGRTLSYNLSLRHNEDKLNGYLNSNTNYFSEENQIEGQEKIDQYKLRTSQSLTARTGIVYTEPLSKKSSILLNYQFTLSDNDMLRNTFNKNDISQSYDLKDSALSNNYKFRYDMHVIGADYKWNSNRWLAVVGGAANFAGFEQQNVNKGSTTNYNFTNFLPKVFLRYSKSPEWTINFRYDGRTNPPTIDQLQPIRENTDPMSIIIGNAALQQEFQHSLNLGLMNFNMKKNQGFFFSVFSNITQKTISTSSQIDTIGKSTTQYVNLGTTYLQKLSGQYTWILKNKMFAGAGSDVTAGKFLNRVNGVLNQSKYQTYSGFLQLSKQSEKYSFSIKPSLSYSVSVSDIRQDIQTNYFLFDAEVSTSYNFPGGFEVSSTAYGNFRQKTKVFNSNLNSVKWDAYIAKKVLRSKKVEIRISVFDILNQNIGFRRNATSNFIVQRSYDSLRRFYLFSLRYSFNKN